MDASEYVSLAFVRDETAGSTSKDDVPWTRPCTLAVVPSHRKIPRTTPAKHQHPTAPYSTTVPSAPVHPFNLQIPRGKHSLSLSVSGGKEVGGRRHLEPQRSKHGSILGRVAQSARRVCQVLSPMCCFKTKLGILHCLNRHTLQRRRKLSTCMLQPLGAHNMNHHTAEKDMHLRV